MKLKNIILAFTAAILPAPTFSDSTLTHDTDAWGNDRVRVFENETGTETTYTQSPWDENTYNVETIPGIGERGRDDSYNDRPFGELQGIGK